MSGKRLKLPFGYVPKKQSLLSSYFSPSKKGDASQEETDGSSDQRVGEENVASPSSMEDVLSTPKGNKRPRRVVEQEEKGNEKEKGKGKGKEKESIAKPAPPAKRAAAARSQKQTEEIIIDEENEEEEEEAQPTKKKRRLRKIEEPAKKPPVAQKKKKKDEDYEQEEAEEVEEEYEKMEGSDEAIELGQVRVNSIMRLHAVILLTLSFRVSVAIQRHRKVSKEDSSRRNLTLIQKDIKNSRRSL